MAAQVAEELPTRIHVRVTPEELRDFRRYLSGLQPPATRQALEQSLQRAEAARRAQLDDAGRQAAGLDFFQHQVSAGRPPGMHHTAELLLQQGPACSRTAFLPDALPPAAFDWLQAARLAAERQASEQWGEVQARLRVLDRREELRQHLALTRLTNFYADVRQSVPHRQPRGRRAGDRPPRQPPARSHSGRLVEQLPSLPYADGDDLQGCDDPPPLHPSVAGGGSFTGAGGGGSPEPRPPHLRHPHHARHHQPHHQPPGGVSFYSDQVQIKTPKLVPLAAVLPPGSSHGLLAPHVNSARGRAAAHNLLAAVAANQQHHAQQQAPATAQSVAATAEQQQHRNAREHAAASPAAGGPVPPLQTAALAAAAGGSAPGLAQQGKSAPGAGASSAALNSHLHLLTRGAALAMAAGAHGGIFTRGQVMGPLTVQVRVRHGDACCYSGGGGLFACTAHLDVHSVNPCAGGAD